MSRPCLARDRVRFVGEPVAVVVADDLARAQDAAELVLVDVDPLPAVLDPTEAAASATKLSPESVDTVVVSTETPSPDNPLGAKGIGESGAIGGPPAIANAVADALRGHDTRGLRMPLTPERILGILRGGRAATAPAAAERT